MGARAESQNDTKAVTGLADEATSIAKQLKSAADDLSKAAAEMKKNPDECKKAAETVMGLLAGIPKMTSDMNDLSKRIGKSVAK